jgi:hypothetical protein
LSGDADRELPRNARAAQEGIRLASAQCTKEDGRAVIFD